MNVSKEIKQYCKNDVLDLENIIKDFTPYISKIIDNMAKEILNDEDKEEIASDVFFILWNNIEKLDINKYMSSYLAGITRNVVKEYLRKLKINLESATLSNTAFKIYLSNCNEISHNEKNRVVTSDKKEYYHQGKSDEDGEISVDSNGFVKYYNTFNLTRFDSTDIITVHLFKTDGQEVIIELEKTK